MTVNCSNVFNFSWQGNWKKELKHKQRYSNRIKFTYTGCQLVCNKFTWLNYQSKKNLNWIEELTSNNAEHECRKISSISNFQFLLPAQRDVCQENDLRETIFPFYYKSFTIKRWTIVSVTGCPPNKHFWKFCLFSVIVLRGCVIKRRRT